MWYGLALGFFALGLMSKPMLVTLPFVMLLLDYWPLGRVSSFEFRVSGWKPLVMEKLPFLALVVASCVATYAAQKAGGAVRDFGIASRLANIPVAYWQYLKKFFVPTDLAVIYPFKPVTAGAGVLAAVLIGGICLGVWRMARTRGYLFTGWFWFMGMLVPVIGVIQVGYQAFADRYTYLPAIGLSAAVVWGVAEVMERWQLPRALPPVIGAAVLGILPWLTRDYLRYWKSTTDLFEHAVGVTGPHTIALKNMGLEYMERGELDRSRNCFEQSLAIEPGDQPTLFNLGSVLLQQQKPEEALRYLDQMKGARVQRHEAAAYAKVAIMLGEQGQPKAAAVFYQKALEGDANQLDALNNLAWLRATATDAQLRNGSEAVRLAERACQLTEQRVPVLLGTLAAAYAEAGRFPDAIATAETARDLARAKQQEGIARSNERLLESYRAGKPVRDTP